mmetsp:Transcript_12797/g.23408  ORF Transcript_12797/g.23408 Transcript_12797/m.23408 type:complete len:227 (+) Transcript_12797:46-726(+)
MRAPDPSLSAPTMTRRNISVNSHGSSPRQLLSEGSRPTPSTNRILADRQSNFVVSLCLGAAFFVLGVVLGFCAAVYDHETTDLAWGISICCFAITMASLRLPIVYHLILTEPTTKWQDDRSYSLYVAIVVVGMSFGLMLPAEFMLIEICINDRSELQWERGGWVCVAALILPMLVGVVACIADIRNENEEREKWLRIRRNRMRKRGDTLEGVSLVIQGEANDVGGG